VILYILRWFCAISILYAWNVIINVLCDEIGWVWIVRSCDRNRILREIKVNLLVCKDVRNPYWLVSWNSNNHSCSDRAEWIMSWGVVGGPSLWTWSEGDLPWERSGDNPLCPDSAEFGNRYRCKPLRVPMSLTQSGYRV